MSELPRDSGEREGFKEEDTTDINGSEAQRRRLMESMGWRDRKSVRSEVRAASAAGGWESQMLAAGDENVRQRVWTALSRNLALKRGQEPCG